MNNCCFIGRLVAEPELKQTASGKNVCSFTLAVRRTKDITDFLNFVAWENKADFIVNYFKKGEQIALTASAMSRNYEDKDGNKRSVTEFKVIQADFCGQKSSSDGQASSSPAESTSTPSYATADEGDFKEIPADDYPF